MIFEINNEDSSIEFGGISITATGCLTFNYWNYSSLTADSD